MLTQWRQNEFQSEIYKLRDWVDLLLLFLLLRFAVTVDKAWNCKILYTTKWTMDSSNGSTIFTAKNTHTHTTDVDHFVCMPFLCLWHVFFQKYVAPPMDVIALHNKYSINKRHRSEKNWRRNLKNFHEWKKKKEENNINNSGRNLKQLKLLIEPIHPSATFILVCVYK